MVEEVRTGRKELVLNTMYKRKKSSGLMPTDSNILPLTSETTPDTTKIQNNLGTTNTNAGESVVAEQESTIVEDIVAPESNTQTNGSQEVKDEKTKISRTKVIILMIQKKKTLFCK